MKILIAHQNFPGQYLHLARYLGAIPGNEVIFITQREDGELPGVRKIVYKPKRKPTKGIHHYLVETEAATLNAQEVLRVALSLKDAGFVPDIMLGHNGWGETWYLKDVYPQVPLIAYFEFFYHANGVDVDFEPGKSILAPDTAPRVRTKNLGNLIGLDAADAGQCATHWQKQLYPKRYQSMLHVLHEGVATQQITPDPKATLSVKDPNNQGSNKTFIAGEEILTFVARNLEPYRGFPSLMRSLPAILKRRPKAQVLIVGADGVSYGAAPPAGSTFRDMLLKELGDSLDLKRVHFLGQLPYSEYLKVLQVSRVHVYLTYPFVLSWSMLEAMSAGCLIVGSSTPPVEEVIRHGENGLLVDMFNTGEITEYVVEALKDAKAYVSLRQAARNTVVENYDLQTVCLPAYLRLLNVYLGTRKQTASNLVNSQVQVPNVVRLKAGQK